MARGRADARLGEHDGRQRRHGCGQGEHGVEERGAHRGGSGGRASRSAASAGYFVPAQHAGGVGVEHAEHPGEQKRPSQLPQRRDLLALVVLRRQPCFEAFLHGPPFPIPLIVARMARRLPQLELHGDGVVVGVGEVQVHGGAVEALHVVGVDEGVHDPAVVGAVVGASGVAAGGGIGEGGGARLV